MLLAVVTPVMLCTMLAVDAFAADIGDKVAFPEKFMFRVASYKLDDLDTKIKVANDKGVGVGYSFVKDFGGSDNDTVPRVDMYYRFNERHRIDFSTYSMDRKGKKTLELEVAWGRSLRNRRITAV